MLLLRDENPGSNTRCEPLPPLRPFSGDLASAYDAARLHLEDVGKVASEGDLQLKAHGFHAIVGYIEIFMHAAAD
jgi:hypothetical protein